MIIRMMVRIQIVIQEINQPGNSPGSARVEVLNNILFFRRSDNFRIAGNKKRGRLLKAGMGTVSRSCLVLTMVLFRRFNGLTLADLFAEKDQHDHTDYPGYHYHYKYRMVGETQELRLPRQ